MHHHFEPIVNRKLRTALVGCGRIADKHFEAIKKFESDIELVAVCDNQLDRLEKAQHIHEVPGYLDFSKLLNEENLDIVILTTPSGIHAEQTIEAAQAGVNVITEKPMATRWKDGVAMVKACDDANVRLFVVKQNRRNATIQLLKKSIDKGRFGKIYSVQLNVFWTRPQEYYDQDKWRGTWEYDGGALMNQASHYIDLMDWMIGPVANVQAMTATLARDIEVEDTAVANIRWRSGALGALNVSMLTYPQNLEGSITILGEKGTVRIGGVAVNEIQTWQFEDAQEEDSQIEDASYSTTSVYGFGHPQYYQNIVKTMRGEAEAETDGREGLKSLELLIALYLSARDGKQIALPLEY